MQANDLLANGSGQHHSVLNGFASPPGDAESAAANPSSASWQPSPNRYTNHADLLLFIREAIEHLRRNETANALDRLMCADQLADLLPRDVASDPNSSIDSDAASLKLCQASAMLYVMAERYERHSQAISRVIPGRLHTDVDMIHAIIECVELAKGIVEGK